MDLLSDCHAWWKFDDDAADYVVASEINSPTDDATMKNTTTAGVSCTGILGKAFDLDADDDECVEVNNASCCNVGSGNWAAAIWMNSSNPRTSMNLAHKRNAVSPYEGWQIRDVSGVRIALICRTNLAVYSCGGFENPYDGDWHLYIAMREGDYIYLYLDNSLSGSPGVISGTLTSNAKLTFGASAGAHNYYWNRKIDNFAFWKRALSASEKKWLWNNGNGQPNLVSTPRPLANGSLSGGRKGMVA